jgi:hypothetical protein
MVAGERMLCSVDEVFRIVAIEQVPEMASYVDDGRGRQLDTPGAWLPHSIVRRIVNLAGPAPSGETAQEPDLGSRTGFRHREWQKCWRLINHGRKCGAKL